MMFRRALTTVTIVVVLAFSLLYDSPAPVPSAPPTPTPGVNCVDHPMQRGLGWELWVLVEECE